MVLHPGMAKQMSQGEKKKNKKWKRKTQKEQKQRGMYDAQTYMSNSAEQPSLPYEEPEGFLHEL